MTQRYRATLLIVFLCGGQMSALAESKPLELKWTELPALIQGHRVQVTLPQGVKLKGEALVVREDSLVLDVNKKSVAVPRDSVTLIELEKTRGDAGRKLGTVIGVISGLVVGGYVTAKAGGSAGVSIPLFLGIASGVTLGGYYSGRGLDRREVTIRVLPRDPEPAK